MDQKYFEEIKAREQAATPGPWKAGGCPRRIRQDLQSVYIKIGCYDGQMDICRDATPTDANFIAHARTDIPALIAEVERLTDMRRIDGEENHDITCRLSHEINRAEQAEAENATLKKALEIAVNPDNFEHCNKDCSGKYSCTECVIHQAQEQEGKNETR